MRANRKAQTTLWHTSGKWRAYVRVVGLRGVDVAVDDLDGREAKVDDLDGVDLNRVDVVRLVVVARSPGEMLGVSFG